MESVNRRFHKPDDPVVASVSLETISETGAPSASSSLIQETSVEKSPLHPSHPAKVSECSRPQELRTQVYRGLRKPLGRVRTETEHCHGIRQWTEEPECDRLLLWKLVAEYPDRGSTTGCKSSLGSSEFHEN